MKNLYLILVALMALSCSTDDVAEVKAEVARPYNGSVNGTWKTTEVVYSSSKTTIVSNCQNDVPEEVNFFYRFNADNTFDIFNTCDIDGELDDESPVVSGSFETQGNIFTLHLGNLEGQAHMVDYMSDGSNVELRFDTGTPGLFYGSHIRIQKQKNALN